MEFGLANCDGSTASLQQHGAQAEAAASDSSHVESLALVLSDIHPSLAKWAAALVAFGAEDIKDLRLLNMADAVQLGIPQLQVSVCDPTPQFGVFLLIP